MGWSFQVVVVMLMWWKQLLVFVLHADWSLLETLQGLLFNYAEIKPLNLTRIES